MHAWEEQVTVTVPVYGVADAANASAAPLGAIEMAPGVPEAADTVTHGTEEVQEKLSGRLTLLELTRTVAADGGAVAPASTANDTPAEESTRSVALGPTVMVAAWEAVKGDGAESVATIVKLKVPEAVGVPEICAPVRLSPGGSEPFVVNVYGAMPPDAVRIC